MIVELGTSTPDSPLASWKLYVGMPEEDLTFLEYIKQDGAEVGDFGYSEVSRREDR